MASDLTDDQIRQRIRAVARENRRLRRRTARRQIANGALRRALIAKGCAPPYWWLNRVTVNLSRWHVAYYRRNGHGW